MNAEYSLLEHEDKWELRALEGREVTRCLVDHAFSLQFRTPDESFELRIESPFELQSPSGEVVQLNPERIQSLGSALGLFSREVRRAVGHKDGRLEVRFSDGSLLTVNPDETYEAWGFTGSVEKLVSTPGGGLAVWVDSDRELNSITS